MASVSNQYEAMFLLGPIGATEPETGLNMCRQTIERHGGKIIVIKKWDERKLAYELAGQKRGTYILAFFNAPGDAVAHIERDVKLSDDILRVMVLKADHLNEQEMAACEPQRPEPKPEFTDRGGFGDRGGYGGDRGGYGGDRGGYGGDRGDRPRYRRDEPAADAPAKE
jgi:ribosomal protein S6